MWMPIVVMNNEDESGNRASVDRREGQFEQSPIFEWHDWMVFGHSEFSRQTYLCVKYVIAVLSANRNYAKFSPIFKITFV